MSSVDEVFDKPLVVIQRDTTLFPHSEIQVVVILRKGENSNDGMVRSCHPPHHTHLVHTHAHRILQIYFRIVKNLPLQELEFVVAHIVGLQTPALLIALQAGSHSQEVLVEVGESEGSRVHEMNHDVVVDDPRVPNHRPCRCPVGFAAGEAFDVSCFHRRWNGTVDDAAVRFFALRSKVQWPLEEVVETTGRADEEVSILQVCDALPFQRGSPFHGESEPAQNVEDRTSVRGITCAANLLRKTDE